MGGGVNHFRINNYDATKQSELKKIVVSKFGVQTTRSDLFFDGTVDDNLVKIVDLNKPLTQLDIQIIKDEIVTNRQDETRNILVFCNGSEVGISDTLAQQINPVNRIVVRDIQQEGMITNRSAEADIRIIKKGKKVKVEILDYISPTILARMDVDRTLFNERMEDYRAQIDYVLIDTDYDEKIFRIVKIDRPEKRKDFVSARYELALPHASARVAVKVVDMLGEEVMEIQ